MDREAWIGLVEVRPRPTSDPLDGAPGAFVNALALANGETDFCELTGAALAELHLEVVAISDVEPLASRVRRTGVLEEIETLATQLSEQNKVQFDEFQAFGH